jgi:hypothetical protein
MLIRLTAPILIVAGPALAHGGHVPASGGWHAFLHLAAPLSLAVLAVAAGSAVARRALRRVRAQR